MRIFLAKPMDQGSGAQIPRELCADVRFDLESVQSANCIACRMPPITSRFMPRHHSHRTWPVPTAARNFALISQFVHRPSDVVFSVEYSVRAAQRAVYMNFRMKRRIRAVNSFDTSLRAQFGVWVKAFK